MKLELKSKIDKRNKATSKKFDNDLMSTNCDAIAFFQFMANIEKSGSRVPDA